MMTVLGLSPESLPIAECSSCSTKGLLAILIKAQFYPCDNNVRVISTVAGVGSAHVEHYAGCLWLDLVG